MKNLRARLRRAGQSDDSVYEFCRLVEELPVTALDVKTVRAVLRFVERNPDVDCGAPGPLVHRLEELHGQGIHEAEPVASVRRQPTAHTLGMLNRLLNATQKAAVRRAYLAAPRSALGHPHADELTRARAAHLLEFQGG